MPGSDASGGSGGVGVPPAWATAYAAASATPSTTRPAARRYLVAESGGAVTGYGCLNVAAAGRGEIQAVAVRGDREGRGIGTALLAALIATAADLGCRDVVLCVRAGNTRARELYLRTGFTEAGLRRRYYQPSGTDAMVMRAPAGAASRSPLSIMAQFTTAGVTVQNRTLPCGGSAMVGL
jgi:ribosomal-protein-alanine N-acetyltransferase